LEESRLQERKKARELVLFDRGAVKGGELVFGERERDEISNIMPRGGKEEK